jgi:hypothetical protein
VNKSGVSGPMPTEPGRPSERSHGSGRGRAREGGTRGREKGASLTIGDWDFGLIQQVPWRVITKCHE